MSRQSEQFAGTLLYENQITIIPECFGNLTNLQTLELSINQITTIPECLGNLTNLQDT